MPAIELNLTAVVAIWMGAVIVLVPLIGLMARFGIAPVIDAIARMRAAGRPAGGSSPVVDARFAGLEERMLELARAVERLQEADADRHAPIG